MSITIEKSKSKFVVRCKYNKELVNAIRKIEERKWNNDKLEWTLPLTAFDDFCIEAKKLGLSISVVDRKPLALITKGVGDNINLQFTQWVNQFDTFRSIEGSYYDAENRKLILPADKINQLVELLNSTDIPFSKPDNDEIRTPVSDKPPVLQQKCRRRNLAKELSD